MHRIDLSSWSKELWKTSLPHLSIDCVVFGFDGSALNVLLLRTIGESAWSLPGGYINLNESGEQAARRILTQRTGAERIYLNNFGVFSDPERSKIYFADYPDELWHKQRFVNLGYYALVDQMSVNPKIDQYSDACQWVALNALPEMVMDHQEIITHAYTVLKEQLSYKPIGINLLPDKFTLPELQLLYQAVLGRKLNRGNFHKKIMRYDILIQLDEKRKGGAYKSPNLYQFDPEKYHKALKGLDW
ncbi:MAG: NUDIX domain-containing protein [Pedobacter sp.]|nr:MAG: NUDIX domain-containing protein [Pedobacter sp.]